MSKELKLSEIRKWRSLPTLTIGDGKLLIELAQTVDHPLGLIDDDVQAILQNAPGECVEQLFGGTETDWAQPGWKPGERPLYLTYRLHPDVTVVDDTVEDGEYEFVGAGCDDDGDDPGQWTFAPPYFGGQMLGLGLASGFRDYICTEVKDAKGNVWFVASWQGEYKRQLMFESVEGFVEALDGLTVGGAAAAYPLTPTRVVFRKRD